MNRLLVAILFASVAATIHAAPIPHETHEWSTPVDGIQARFSFGLGNLVNGTRIVRIFLELRNSSDLLTPVYLLYDPSRSIKAELYNSAGKPVHTACMPADIMTPDPFLICLPQNSTLILDVTANGYGIPKDGGAFIGLLSQDWLIKTDDSSDFFLDGNFLTEKPKEPIKEKVWTGHLNIPKARVDVLK